MYKIYHSLPNFLQDILFEAYSLKNKFERYDGNFYKYLDEYLNHRLLSIDETLDIRSRRIEAMVRHAYLNTAYYKREFLRIGFDPFIDDVNDNFVKLPVITKNTVLENYNDFFSNEKGSKLFINTSGTSGAFLRYPMDRINYLRQWAIWWRYRIAHGINLGTPMAQFAGRAYVPYSRVTPPFWKFSKASNQLFLSIYHLSDANIGSYVKEIRKRNILWIHGHPSALNLLSIYMLKNGHALPTVKWVSIGAEALLPSIKENIAIAFGIEPIQHYGLVEAVANISQDPVGELCVDEDFSYVEFIESSNAMYDIIGTSLHNFGFPLIRYASGDSVLSPSSTMHNLSVLRGRTVREIVGRSDDYLICRRGYFFGRLDFIFKHTFNIMKAQFQQSKAGEFKLSLQPNKNFSDADLFAINKELKNRFADSMDYEIILVDSIKSNGNGKVKLVISSIDKGVHKNV